jgi:hypothetical protein
MFVRAGREGFLSNLETGPGQSDASFWEKSRPRAKASLMSSRLVGGGVLGCMMGGTGRQRKAFSSSAEPKDAELYRVSRARHDDVERYLGVGFAVVR